MSSVLDVITAVGAVATAGTLVLGILLYAQQILDKRQAQARLVAGWQHDLREGAEWVELAIRLRNASDLPVYGVIANLVVGVRGTFSRQAGTLAPRETRELVVLLPGFPRGFLVEPALIFTDAAGRSWVRGAGGKLRKARDADWQAMQHQDAGAHDSLEAHPTMDLHPGEFPFLGRRVD